jgi:hypothetical protein
MNSWFILGYFEMLPTDDDQSGIKPLSSGISNPVCGKILPHKGMIIYPD